MNIIHFCGIAQDTEFIIHCGNLGLVNETNSKGNASEKVARKLVFYLKGRRLTSPFAQTMNISVLTLLHTELHSHPRLDNTHKHTCTTHAQVKSYLQVKA